MPSADKESVAVEKLGQAKEMLLREVHKRIVGQEDVIEQILIALFSRGHCLMIGVPGLAKTLMVSTVAEVLKLSFNRIQFTPDLMPADITGTDIIEEDAATRRREYRFVKGPIFANIILADEINRTQPKTQSALLEAMQERQVTAAGTRYPLDPPFFVLATQNPIEQEGTYPLPEAQLDRFMFNIYVNYPTLDEEREIVATTTVDAEEQMKSVLSGSDIIALQQIVRRVPASPHVIDYALKLTRATRPTDELAPEFVREWLTWGAGPRAAQYLVIGAKARAVLSGRYAATCDDIRANAPAVLRHRMFTNFTADSEGVTPGQIIERLLDEVQPPSEDDY